MFDRKVYGQSQCGVLPASDYELSITKMGSLALPGPEPRQHSHR